MTHDGTVVVGESLVEEPAKLLATGIPVVLCATVRAVGSAWAHRLVNAAHAVTNCRVYVVQMDADAYVETLSLSTKVARYDQDPTRAVTELIEALRAHFPSEGGGVGDDSLSPATDHFLDQPTTETTFDPDAITRYRQQLRDEATSAYPEPLSPYDFLAKVHLIAGRMLTRAGLLLFGSTPERILPTAIIQCARYHGHDRTASHDIVRVAGPLMDQIAIAWKFIADRVAVGDVTTGHSVQAMAVYRYPMGAVREVLVNAVVHRRYENAETCVHVRLFDDRLEITSAGEWVGRQAGNDTTQDLALLESQSRSRNFRLAHLLAAVRVFEGEGSGIPAAVADCRACGAPEPKVIQRADSVTVVLRPTRDQIAAATEAVPHQLPAQLPNFIGRLSELAWLEQASIVSPIVVVGLPGVGKTALALHWAHGVRDRFPDGQLYIDLRGFSSETPRTPGEALRALLDSLGIRNDRVPDDIEDQAALFRSVIGERRMLVLLDNAASAEQVRPLLPASNACATLITSRHILQGLEVSAGAQRLYLDSFSPAEAHSLLSRHIGNSRVEAEADAVSVLVRLCAGLPLALSVVASHAAARPEQRLSELAAELRDEVHRLDTLGVDENAANVRVVFSWSYQRLSSQAAALFRLISLHPGPDLDMYAAANLIGEGLAQTRRLLDELTRANFLSRRQAGRFSLHDLLRLYGRELAHAEDGTDQRTRAADRMVTYYVRATVLADRRLDDAWEAIEPGDDVLCPELSGYDEAFAWLSAERATLLALVGNAVKETHLDSYVWQIAWALTTFLYRNGYWHDWAAVNEIALSALRRHGDVRGQARTHRILGSAYARLGRYDDAVGHHLDALGQFEQLDDVDGQAHSHLMLGRCYEWQGRYSEALDHAQQALRAYRVTGNRAWQARSLTDVGRVHSDLGNYQECVAHCQEALALSRRVEDEDAEAAALHTLGRAVGRLGRHRNAATVLRQAVQIRSRLADRYEEAETLADLGDELHELQDTASAQDVWTRALETLESLKHPMAERVKKKLAAS